MTYIKGTVSPTAPTLFPVFHLVATKPELPFLSFFLRNNRQIETMSTMEIHTDIGSVITSLGLTEADTGKLREFDREVRGVDGGNIAYLTVDSDSGFWSLQTERDDLIRYSYMNRRQEGSKQVKQWRSFVIKEGAILERAGDKWRQALSSLRVGEGESVHGMEEYPTLPMEVVEALCAAVAVTRRSAWVDSEGGRRR